MVGKMQNEIKVLQGEKQKLAEKVKAFVEGNFKIKTHGQIEVLRVKEEAPKGGVEIDKEFRDMVRGGYEAQIKAMQMQVEEMREWVTEVNNTC